MSAARRLEVIDFLRGIAILEMVAAHFSRYFPPAVGKAVGYTETAMALFVLLAGFVVGWQRPQFAAAPRAQTLAMWNRALRIFVAQSLLILTLGLPLHLAGVPAHDNAFGTVEFLWRSFTFENQIGLLHILPTFIPLFLVSPLILLGLSRSGGWLVLGLSVAVFCVGLRDPHALDLGAPTIFPFLLFQLYFVIGCLLGSAAQRRQSLALPRSAALAIGAALWLLAVMVIVHGHVLPAGSLGFHPLNLPGFLYHASILLALCLATLACWPRFGHSRSARLIQLFGRNALLAFVLHVYFAKGIEALAYFQATPATTCALLAVASVIVMWWVIRQYEARVRSTAPPAWVRLARYLFR